MTVFLGLSDAFSREELGGSFRADFRGEASKVATRGLRGSAATSLFGVDDEPTEKFSCSASCVGGAGSYEEAIAVADVGCSTLDACGSEPGCAAVSALVVNCAATVLLPSVSSATRLEDTLLPKPAKSMERGTASGSGAPADGLLVKLEK